MFQPYFDVFSHNTFFFFFLFFSQQLLVDLLLLSLISHLPKSFAFFTNPIIEIDILVLKKQNE